MKKGNYYSTLHIYVVEGYVGKGIEDHFAGSYLGNWVEGNWSFLFFSEPCREDLAELLSKYTGLRIVDEYCFPYDEWQGGRFDAFTVGSLKIVPSWERQCDVEEDAIEILLDPGVVFGNGLHPTTRDCLRALVYLRRLEPFRHVIDVGTGSGILSLAAAKLGAQSVQAVDSNPLCVQTARRNVLLNRLEDIVTVVEDDAGRVASKGADLLLANLHYDVMPQVIENGCRGKTRWFILSGLMRTQARCIGDQIEHTGMKLIKEWDHDMTWYTMLVRG